MVRDGLTFFDIISQLRREFQHFPRQAGAVLVRLHNRVRHQRAYPQLKGNGRLDAFVLAIEDDPADALLIERCLAEIPAWGGEFTLARGPTAGARGLIAEAC